MPAAPSSSRRAAWRLLWQVMRRQRRTIWLGVLAGLVWTAAKVAIPTLTGAAIDHGVVEQDGSALLKWCLAIVAVGCVSAVCVGLRRWYAFGVAYRAETELRMRLFAHLQRLHFAFHDETSTGQLMSRSATDLQQVQSFVVLIPITISNFVTVAAVTVVLLSMNVRLAILALGALPLLNIAAKKFSSA